MVRGVDGMIMVWVSASLVCELFGASRVMGSVRGTIPDNLIQSPLDPKPGKLPAQFKFPHELPFHLLIPDHNLQALPFAPLPAVLAVDERRADLDDAEGDRKPEDEVDRLGGRAIPGVDRMRFFEEEVRDAFRHAEIGDVDIGGEVDKKRIHVLLGGLDRLHDQEVVSLRIGASRPDTGDDPCLVAYLLELCEGTVGSKP